MGPLLCPISPLWSVHGESSQQKIDSTSHLHCSRHHQIFFHLVVARGVILKNSGLGQVGNALDL